MDLMYRHPEYGLIQVHYHELTVDHLIRMGLRICDAEDLGRPNPIPSLKQDQGNSHEAH
jgi:hypothetical protein